MHSFNKDLFRRTMREASDLTAYNGKSTITSLSIQAANAVNECTRAVTKFNWCYSYLGLSNNAAGSFGSNASPLSGKCRAKKQSFVGRSSKAGLQFPVGRLHPWMREGRYATKIGSGARVYCDGVHDC